MTKRLSPTVFPPSPQTPLGNSAASPIIATCLTFWSFLVTNYAKLRAATNQAGIQWRINNAHGSICHGTCFGVQCTHYNDTTHPSLKFDKPDGMSNFCQWFPVEPKVPESGIDYSAVIIYCNLIAQLACGFFLVFFGCIGDFGKTRYNLLLFGSAVFSLSPIIATIVSDTSYYWISAVCYVLTVVANLTAQQMFYAYLPLLAKSHWLTRAAAAGQTVKMPDTKGWWCVSLCGDAILPKVEGGRGGIGAGGDKLPAGEADSEGAADSEVAFTIRERTAMTRQSVASLLAFVGPALAFFSLFLVTIAQLLIVSMEDDVLLALRLCVMVAGMWAIFFSCVAFTGLKVRAGKPIPKEDNFLKSAMAMFSQLGFRRSWLTVMMIYKHHRDMGKLMLGQLLSSITNGTVIASYTVFIQRELNANPTDIIIILAIVAVAACVGVSSVAPFMKRLPPRTLKWIFFTFKCATPCWALWMAFGFHRRWEMFAMVGIAGLINPNILPLLRAIFQQVVPLGYEAAFFSLIGVSTVSFTWIGSLTMAGVLSATGSMRGGCIAIIPFVLVGLALLFSFDFDKAQADARSIEEDDAIRNGEFKELRNTSMAPVRQKDQNVRK